MLLGSAIRVLITALHPGWWAVLYQLPIGFGVAYLIAGQQARSGISRGSILQLAAIAGIGGALIFFFLMTFAPGLFTALLSIAIMWIGTSYGLDKCLDVDWESSQRITGLICGPIWLAWLIVGAVIIVIR